MIASDYGTAKMPAQQASTSIVWPLFCVEGMPVGGSTSQPSFPEEVCRRRPFTFFCLESLGKVLSLFLFTVKTEVCVAHQIWCEFCPVNNTIYRVYTTPFQQF